MLRPFAAAWSIVLKRYELLEPGNAAREPETGGIAATRKAWETREPVALTLVLLETILPTPENVNMFAMVQGLRSLAAVVRRKSGRIPCRNFNMHNKSQIRWQIPDLFEFAGFLPHCNSLASKSLASSLFTPIGPIFLEFLLESWCPSGRWVPRVV